MLKRLKNLGLKIAELVYSRNKQPSREADLIDSMSFSFTPLTFVLTALVFSFYPSVAMMFLAVAGVVFTFMSAMVVWETWIGLQVQYFFDPYMTITRLLNSLGINTDDIACFLLNHSAGISTLLSIATVGVAMVAFVFVCALVRVVRRRRCDRIDGTTSTTSAVTTGRYTTGDGRVRSARLSNNNV